MVLNRGRPKVLGVYQHLVQRVRDIIYVMDSPANKYLINKMPVTSETLSNEVVLNMDLEWSQPGIEFKVYYNFLCDFGQLT